MNKIKTLCDLDKKEIDKRLEQLTDLVADPKYFCRKCIRVARKKEYLCKPQKLSQILS